MRSLSQLSYNPKLRRKPSSHYVEQFWLKVHQDETTGCWEWQGYQMPNGYGRHYIGLSQYAYAHRYSFELLEGPIPDGLDIDHLCRNRICVNPGHLEAVTRRENLMRGETLIGANAKKTHCIHGHELTPENCIPDKQGRRLCRECHRIRGRNISPERRAKKNAYMRKWWAENRTKA